VRFGGSCAAVTGYDFPWPVPRKRDEGGKEDGNAGRRCRKPGARTFPRPFSFVAQRVRVPSKKLLRKKRSNEGSIGSSACCSARSMAWCVVVSPPNTSEMLKRKRFTDILAGAVLFIAATANAQTFTLPNIQNWVGTGSNQAGFVIAWNDGKTPDSLVFGYKWSGAGPTVFEMMQAIEAANSRFSFTAHPSYPDSSVFSAFYDLTGNGGAPVVGTPGLTTETGHPSFSGDHYAEGWFTGFWGELVGIGNPYNGGSWTSDYPAVQGVGADTVTNSSWYGLSFSTDLVNYSIPNPGFPTEAPVTPEPSAVCLLSLGALGLFGGRTRHKSRRQPRV